MSDLKLGKKPATFDLRDFLFTDVVEPGIELKIAPIGFGLKHIQMVKEWGMLGNDDWGDCVLAGGDHESMLWNALGQRQVKFTTDNALQDYSAITGFNPNDPSTDQGTNMREAANYRRRTGLVDANGSRHKIGAYVSLEPGNWDQMLEALYAFDAVGLGFIVPDYAMDQWRAGKPWSLHRGADYKVLGGHYVPAVARPYRYYVDVVSWGRVQRMGKGFYQTFCDEAIAMLTEESLVSGKSPEGFDLTKLQELISKL